MAPPPSIFKTERTRVAAVAVIMLIVLVLSLLLASTLTRQTEVQVGALELTVPARWRPLDLQGQSGVTYADRNQIVRFRLIPQQYEAPRHPSAVLEEVVQGLQRRAVLKDVAPEPFAPIRRGELVGYTTRVATPRDGGALLVLQRVAVLTDDGRRYWVLIVNDYTPMYPGLTVETLPWPDRLFELVLEGLRLEQSPAAERDDLARAGLAPPTGDAAMPDGLRAVATSDEPTRPAVRFELPGRAAAFGRLRARGVPALPDAGEPTTPADAPQHDARWDPAALLSDLYERVHNERPADGAVMGESIDGDDGPDLWKLRLAEGSSNELSSELWYADIGGGRAVMVELLADTAEPVEPLHAHARAVIDWQRRALGQADASAADAAAALRRGQRIADWFTRDFAASMADGTSYWLINVHDQPFAFAATRFEHTGEPGEQPFHLRTMWMASGRDARTGGEGEVLAHADGSRSATKVVNVTYRRDEPTVSEGYSLRIGDGEVYVIEDDAELDDQDQPVARWRMPTPQPMAPYYAWDERWPIDLLYNGDQTEGGARDGGDGEAGQPAAAALLWSTAGRYRPTPVWVEPEASAQPLAGTVGKVQGLRAVRVRPAMQMDDEYLLIDETGRVQAMIAQDQHESPAGSTRLVWRRVDREAVETAFPSQKKLIEEVTGKLTEP